MIPDWLNDAVQGFGRQMGLKEFTLNDRGVAGVRFENGFTFKLEYAAESLMLIVGVPMASDKVALGKLLAEAHPLANAHTRKVRAAYVESTGEAILVTRVPEREVGVSALQEAFGWLWERAQRLGRIG